MVIASIHLADVGFFRSIRTRPPRRVEGLIHANVAQVVPLASSPLLIRRGRVGLVAFWDDDDALDGFLADHPLARRMAGGWHARLEPLRAHGDWPGLPDDINRSRATTHEGLAVVLTLGRLRLSQARRFLRTSRPAEAAALEAPGLIWGTALAKPPFVATCSLWESDAALSKYAYGQAQPAHPDAIAIDAAKPFHKQSSFIRFRPYRAEGSLGGLNPLVADALSATS